MKVEAGQLWTDPLGRTYLTMREVSGGDWEMRRVFETFTVAPELLRPGSGWTLIYNPEDFGGVKAEEWRT